MNKPILLHDTSPFYEIYFLPQTEEEATNFEKDYKKISNIRVVNKDNLNLKKDLELTFYARYNFKHQDVLYYGDVDYPADVLRKIISHVIIPNREIYAGSASWAKGKSITVWRSFDGSDYRTQAYDLRTTCLIRNETAVAAWKDMLNSCGNPKFGVTFKIEH